MKIKRPLLHGAILIVLVTVLLFVGVGTVYDHRILHDFPHGYIQRDMFERLYQTNYILESGKYQYVPMYTAEGHEDVLATYSHRGQHLTVLLSTATGIPTHEILILTGVFLVVFTSLLIYGLLKEINENLAILAVPFTLVHALFFKATWVQYQGDWFAFSSGAAVLYFIWTFSKRNLPYMWLLSAAFLTTIVLDKVSAMLFVVIFFVLYFSHQVLTTRKIPTQDLWITTKIGIATIVLSAYYFFLFQIANPSYQAGNLFDFVFAFENFNSPFWNHFTDFGWVLSTIIIIGIIVFAIDGIRKQNPFHLLIVSMVIGFYSHHLGVLTPRVEEYRFILPMVAAIFFGYGLYLLILFIPKFKTLAAALLSVLMIIIIPQMHASPFSASSTLMDQPHWEALMWSKDNSLQNDTFFFFFDDIYYFNYNSIHHVNERLGYVPTIGANGEQSDLVQAIQTGMIVQEYTSYFESEPKDHGLVHRTSFWTVDKYYTEDIRNTKMDICSFNYVVFRLIPEGSRVPAAIQYGLLIRQELLQKDWIDEVFTNQVVSILKNNKVGVDCIEERSFQNT
jgi:hypothetical protein